MKRFAILTAAAMTLATSAVAQDRTGSFYFQVDGGVSYFNEEERNDIEVSYDLGYAFGGRIGVYATDRVRLEGDLSYANNDFDKLDGVSLSSAGIEADVTVISFGGGVFFDLTTTGATRPYLGAGAGLANKEIDANINVDTLDATDLMAFGEAGLSFGITPNLHLVPHYRLIWLDEYADDAQLVQWIRLGLRFGQ